MASVEADWSLREVTGPCSVANQTTSVKQIDNDNCPISEDSTPVTEDLRNHDRSHRRRKMRPNSEYNVSVTVFVGHQEFTAWKLIRTEETGKVKCWNSPWKSIFDITKAIYRPYS